MKKVLFYLNIALAIFFLNSLCATGVHTESGFKTATQEYAFDSNQISSENPFFDIYFEDILEDDLTDSERKKPASVQISQYNASFVAQNFSDNNFKEQLPADHFFPCKASIITFLCVFRI